MGKIKTTTVDKSVFVVVPPAIRKAAKAKYEASSFWDATTGKEVNVVKDRLITKKDVDDLGVVLDMIYPKSKYVPSQLQGSNDELIDMGTIVRYFPRDHYKSKEQLILAYVMREFMNNYRIFINEDAEDEAFDSMDLHEKGHILFNHTQSIKAYLDQFRKELDQIWDLKIAKYFEKSVIKTSKDQIVRMLYAEFSNIAQDMEINSKLFDNGEWVKAKKTMARSGMIVQLKGLQREFDSLSGLIKNKNARKNGTPEYEKLVNNFLFIRDNIKDRIKGEEGDFQFCYPANKGWPEKLDWMTYLILLIKDIDDTMEQVIKQIMSKVGQQGQGQGQPGQANGKTISQNVLDNYMKQQAGDKDAMNDANGGGLDDDDTEDPGDGDQNGGSARGTQRNVGGNDRGRGHGGVKVDFETVDTFTEFTKFLRKNCLGKKNRRLNSDVLYNSNRGKFSSKVVVPRRHLTEKWMPTECHIIVDVSGSVPTDYVERVINSIVDTNSGIDLAHSHIIFCDEKVVSDEIMSKRTKEVYAGGGTCMANGIKYVASKGYLKRATDKLFIISDFQDNLDQWVKAAEGLPGIKWAVGYNVSDEKEAGSLVNRQTYGGDSDSEFAKAWNKTFKTIFVTQSIRD
jgi:hypothetical protein